VDKGNHFSLFREILPYGEDCMIISPLDVHDEFSHKLRLLWDKYAPETLNDG
jgi:predicted DNA-binding transcriptional regulator YafY